MAKAEVEKEKEVAKAGVEEDRVEDVPKDSEVAHKEDPDVASSGEEAATLKRSLLGGPDAI